MHLETLNTISHSNRKEVAPMTITGPKKLPAKSIQADVLDVDEAVNTTVELLRQLEVVSDEESLRSSLTSDYQRLTELGGGRLYVELPATVTFTSLVELANKLAQKAGFDDVYWWPSFWVPGTEKESVTENELNGSTLGYTARLALYGDNQYDKLLHFAGLSYDRKYASRKDAATQVKRVDRAVKQFAADHKGANLRASDHCDFLVWYLMDLIRGVPASEVVMVGGFMRVPVLGRRAVDGGSCVGFVYSYGGRANLRWSRGLAGDNVGVGLSAGFEED